MSLRTRLSSLARYDALVLASLIWFLAKFLRYAFPPLFGTLQDTYGVSNTVLGTAFTGFMLVYAAMQFPSGVLADRLGSVRVIVAGALVASATALALFVPAPFAVLVVGMLLVGFGTGMHKTVSVGLLSRAYSNRPGRALGVFDTIGGFGGAVAPVVIVAFAAFGWRSVFLVGGLAGVVLAVLFAYQVPRRLPESTHATAEADPDADLRSYLAMFGDRRFTAFVLVTILVSFAFNGVVAFLPLYLTDYAGLTPAFASAVYGAMFAVTLVQPVTGELSDRIGQLPIIGVTVVLATAGLGGLLFLSGPYALAASVLVFAAGNHGIRPVRGSYLVRVIPADTTGGTLGIVRSMLMGAGAVSPAIIGFVSDRVGFQPAFAVLVAGLLLAVVLTGAIGLGDDLATAEVGARAD